MRHLRLALWIAVLLQVLGAESALPDPDHALNSMTAAFFNTTGAGVAYFNDFKGSATHASFWMTAEMIEMVQDAYDRSGNMAYAQLALDLIGGFLVEHGSDWSNNDWNDDIMYGWHRTMGVSSIW
jgi:hypothetical protein